MFLSWMCRSKVDDLFIHRVDVFDTCVSQFFKKSITKELLVVWYFEKICGIVIGDDCVNVAIWNYKKSWENAEVMSWSL